MHTSDLHQTMHTILSHSFCKLLLENHQIPRHLISTWRSDRNLLCKRQGISGVALPGSKLTHWKCAKDGFRESLFRLGERSRVTPYSINIRVCWGGLPPTARVSYISNRQPLDQPVRLMKVYCSSLVMSPMRSMHLLACD